MRILILLLAVVAGAQAQPAVVTGVVRDARTGEPIALANVYVPSTTIGVASGPDGSFRLEVPAFQEVIVIASSHAHVSGSEEVALEPGGAADLDFRLRPRTARGPEAVGEGEREEGWERQLGWFRRLFLGQTANAARTVIETPSVLRFSEYRGELTARVTAPLVTVNEALGYRAVWDGLSFRGNASRREWSGEVRFEPLEGTARQQSAWDRARAETYRGSWRHFLTALVAGRVAAEGFEVFPVDAAGEVPAFGLPLRGGPLGEALAPMAGRRVWLVQYLREEAPRDVDIGPTTPLNGSADASGRVQRSWVQLGVEGLQVSQGGQIRNPDRHELSGYWDWERAADLLPADYTPPE